MQRVPQIEAERRASGCDRGGLARIRLRGARREPVAARWGIALLALVLSLGGCATGPQVTRTESDTVVDLSGLWNDTDSQMVSAEMIDDSLNRVWIDDWRGATGQKPTVIVGAVRNRSSEHINTRTFTKDLERAAFVNSGRVRRRCGRAPNAKALRAERLDQLRNATIESAKSMGKEIGADFMLLGSVSRRSSTPLAGRSVRFYQVKLELIDLEIESRRSWIGQKKIKKDREAGTLSACEARPVGPLPAGACRPNLIRQADMEPR